LSRLADFFHQQLLGYGLLSADNKIQSVKLRTLSRLAVFFFYQWGLVLLKKKAAINKAPLLGVVDARFPVIAHHRCAHDSPYTVWAPHRAYQYFLLRRSAQKEHQLKALKSRLRSFRELAFTVGGS
jgi:hypothetical protein